jgi:hypothetical protein
MKKLLLAVIAALFVPTVTLAASWDKVPLIDNMCQQKEKVKADPDGHPASCLLKCGKNGGFGVVTSDGKFLKLDAGGNQKAVAALEKTSKKDHVRVNVSGEQKGDTIQVAELTIPD